MTLDHSPQPAFEDFRRRNFQLIRAMPVITTFLTLTLSVLVLITGVNASDAPTQSGVADVRYVVRHPSSEGRTYSVSISFVGLPSGVTVIRIPTSYVQATGADKGIQRLRVSTLDAKLSSGNEAGSMSISHRPNERLTVLYDAVPLDTAVPNSDSSSQYLPVMQPTYLHWVGPTSWVIPMIPSGGMASITFENLPPDWAVASSFGIDRGLHFKWSPNTLLNSLTLAGDFRLVTKQTSVGGRRITLAIRGTWPVTDETFAANLLKIIDGQQQFWEDGNGADFVAALMPLEKKVFSTMTGTAFVNSFTTFVTPDKTPREIERLWTHESMHQWLPRAFGRIAAPSARLSWFGEGFTDYYTQVLMLRWGLIELQDFVDEFNAALKKLAESDYAMLSNDEVAAGFARNRSIQTLAYQRGMLLAASWDSDIRAASKGEKSLDDALRWLRAEQQKTLGAALNRGLIEAAVKRFGVVDPAADVDRFVEPGEPVQARFAGSLPCIASENIAITIADPGFSIAASERDKKISGVVEHSAAHEAGLRNGQDVAQMPQATAAPNREVKVKVRVNGEIKELRYVPDAQKQKSLQQLKVKNDASCASFFALKP